MFRVVIILSIPCWSTVVKVVTVGGPPLSTATATQREAEVRGHPPTP